VRAEVDAIYADGREVSYQALREIPELEAGIKESLRLHPPLIILMRKVAYDFHYDGTRARGQARRGVARGLEPDARVFPDPDRFDPRAMPRAAKRIATRWRGSRSAPAAIAAWARHSR
jgi:sterol 14-demethylase